MSMTVTACIVHMPYLGTLSVSLFSPPSLAAELQYHSYVLTRRSEFSTEFVSRIEAYEAERKACMEKANQIKKAVDIAERRIRWIPLVFILLHFFDTILLWGLSQCWRLLLLGGLLYYFQMLLQIERSTSMIFTFTPYTIIIATILRIDLWEWLLVGVVIAHKCTIHVKQMTQYAATVTGISAVLWEQGWLYSAWWQIMQWTSMWSSIIVSIILVITGEGIRSQNVQLLITKMCTSLA